MAEPVPQSLVVRVETAGRLAVACDCPGFSLPKPHAQRVGQIGGQRRQGSDDLGGVLYQCRALPDQAVAAAGPGIVDRAGNREHLATGLARLARGDQCAGLLGRFHHQRAQGQAGQDPVAGGEVGTQGGSAGRMLADHGAFARQAFAQPLVGGWIGEIGAGPDDGEGGPRPAGQGRLMRLRVDAARHAAGDHDARRRQSTGEGVCVVAAAAGRRAAAHHRHRRSPQQGRVAVDEKRQRRAGNRAQRCGVVGVVPAHQVMAGDLQPVPRARQGFADGPILEGCDLRRVQPGRAPCACTRGERRRR